MENNPELDARRLRAAQNQSLFRDLNEQVAGVRNKWATDGTHSSFVCECLDLNCSQSISLSHDEYEALRKTATRFAVAPGHEVLEVEVVVDKTDRYFVVRKIGVAGEVATDLDLRWDENLSTESAATVHRDAAL